MRCRDVPYRAWPRCSQHVAEGLAKEPHQRVEIEVIVSDQCSIVATPAWDVLCRRKIAAVGRVGKTKRCLVAVHEAFYLRTIRSVAGHYPVRATVAVRHRQQPKFAGSSYRGFGRIGHRILIVEAAQAEIERRRGKFL